MGWLDKVIKRSPEVDAAIEAEKQRLQKQGAEISARLAAETAARKVATEEEYKAKVSRLDKEIQDRMQVADQELNSALTEHVFMNLDMALRLALTPTLARINSSNPAEALKAMTDEISNQISSIRAKPDEAKIMEVENWAMQKVAGNPQSEERIRKAFVDLRRELNK